MIKTSYDPAADAMFIWLAPEDAVSVELGRVSRTGPERPAARGAR